MIEKAAFGAAFVILETMKHQIDFYTSYNQFYITDKDAGGATNSDKFWTTEAFTERLAVEDGILGVGVECYGPVKGEVYLLNSSNDTTILDEYDHIVEAGIEIKSGVIQIMDCPNSNVELELRVEIGLYRVRIYSCNLASVDGDEGEDYYKIEIWPDAKMERKVLKQYSV
ncbi:hypothetical protein GWR56_19870 [Mucilaginibacter sp. 14171R-50]|uniref:hypothetical protein n=1 Tax=Mucilaginibacter sp. 14171R-50 TaxID=2703789 RepID=UPI00138DB868|nr:hypothetical protein [Mucilaginibacter sp. 14171R-50]QHS57691.1 hypothetical protein GWR56_19870 [Mucilaginibacter sp. 14171R-50]